MKLLVMQFSPVSCYLTALRLNTIIILNTLFLSTVVDIHVEKARGSFRLRHSVPVVISVWTPCLRLVLNRRCRQSSVIIYMPNMFSHSVS
jgi:hypothetical protein